MRKGMNYLKKGIEQHRRLKEYAGTRFSALGTVFQDEIELVTGYEQLICRATVILGNSPPRDVTDRAIRDLLADVFDFLHVSQQLILENYASTAFPLLRRAFESISLIQYFILLPNKAITWSKGGQVGNAEIRKYLDSHPMGESEKAMKDVYAFLSRATHPSRDCIPTRFLGEDNQFVLGGIVVPDLIVIADYIVRLIDLWYWFAASISYYYVETFDSADKSYGNDYMKVADKAKKVREALLTSRNELWENEHGK